MLGELVFDRQDAISNALKILEVAGANFCGIQQNQFLVRLGLSSGRAASLFAWETPFSPPTIAEAPELLIDGRDVHRTGLRSWLVLPGRRRLFAFPGLWWFAFDWTSAAPFQQRDLIVPRVQIEEPETMTPFRCKVVQIQCLGADEWEELTDSDARFIFGLRVCDLVEVCGDQVLACKNVRFPVAPSHHQLEDGMETAERERIWD
jgi:hypothetical protein